MKSALILGATSDVAKALSVVLSIQGYKLILAGRKLTDLEPIKSDLEIRHGANVELIEFDATKFDSHQQLIKSLTEVPDITCAIFGYLGDQPTAEKDWNEAKRIIDTNYVGAVSILNAVANEYESLNKGIIVGVSSVAGERGRKSNFIYGSAKAGFSAYLSGLRNRFGKSKVHVLTVKPGFINTRMTEGLDLPKPLTASPEEVAKAIWSGIRKKKNIIYVYKIWRLIMYIIKSIPESIFKKLNL